MASYFTTVAPWILSATTVWTLFLAGNKSRNTWLVGLFSQCLWLAWILASQTWGMLPGNIALWIVYARNHFKWSTEQVH